MKAIFLLILFTYTMLPSHAQDKGGKELMPLCLHYDGLTFKKGLRPPEQNTFFTIPTQAKMDSLFDVNPDSKTQIKLPDFSKQQVFCLSLNIKYSDLIHVYDLRLLNNELDVYFFIKYIPEKTTEYMKQEVFSLPATLDIKTINVFSLDSDGKVRKVKSL